MSLTGQYYVKAMAHFLVAEHLGNPLAFANTVQCCP